MNGCNISTVTRPKDQELGVSDWKHRSRPVDLLALSLPKGTTGILVPIQMPKHVEIRRTLSFGLRLFLKQRRNSTITVRRFSLDEQRPFLHNRPGKGSSCIPQLVAAGFIRTIRSAFTRHGTATLNNSGDVINSTRLRADCLRIKENCV